MIGRSPALRRLCGLVEAAQVATGDPPEVALVAGEAGIGKTRLVREVIALVPPGTRVFTMSARPGSVGRAHDALETFAAHHDEPENGGPAPTQTSDPAARVLDQVSRAAAEHPVLVVVEDVHWIDAASALVVDRIAQQPWPRLVLLASYRSGELTPGSPGGELVARLERRHDVEQVRIERLSRTEVGALVASIRGRPASSAVIEALHRRSGGVPFVIEELLRCCGPDSVADDVVTASLPWSLDEAVRMQITGFGSSVRAVLDALAVLGRPSPFDLVVEVSGLDERTTVDALRELIGADVVEEAADDVVWFTHALVADAVSAQMLGRERRRLHERCAAALARDPDADPAALARHTVGAGRYEELPAIARRGAARYLAEGASFQALRLAADALEEEPDDPALLAVATDAAWRLGFLEEAFVTARRWAVVAEERAARIEALRFVGRLGVELGDPRTTEAACSDLALVAEEMAELGDRRSEGLALAALAQVQMLGPDPVAAVSIADRALWIAVELDDPVIAARASVERASALVHTGAPRAETTAALRAAVAAARSVDEPVLMARVINNLLDQVPSQSEEAEELRRELAAVGRSAGVDLFVFGGVHWWEAEAARCRGDLGAYRRSIADARQWWRLHGDARLLAMAEARLAYEEGRDADARAAVTALAEASDGRLQRYQAVDVVFALGAGDVEQALTMLDELAASPLRYDSPRVVEEVLMLVDALLAAGRDPDEVERQVHRRWLAEHPSAELFERATAGLFAAARNDHAGAVAAFREVLHEPDPALTVPWIGSLRSALAASLLALGQRDQARREIRRALDEDLARWPGVRRDRALQLARRLEGANRTAEGELTHREREVAALLVGGVTNAQLAERLYISPRTAAVHVSNILTKLGLQSRAEIAAWAVRNGLDREPV